MTRKTIYGLIALLGVLALGATAFAHGPGYGHGYGHMGYGYHQGWGSNQYDEATAKLHNQVYQKQLELNTLLNAPEVDENKVNNLQGEINKLRTELSEKFLAAELEFRKNNPNAGRDYGPGACWR